ncbi:MAG TPA: hypothetical protein VG013_02465, partial [Gemmataceae bacterium]|nr:hypothetical protein [Gemmataceae bacterium]
MTRRVLASLVMLTLALVVIARADNPINLKVDPKKTDQKDDAKLDPASTIEDAAIKQERLSRQFREFEGALLRLAQRMETSPKPEDREKAAVLKKAIEKAMTEGVDTKFDKLVNLLQTSKAITPDALQKVMDQNKDLANDIRTILAILLTDNRDEELRKEKERIQDLIKRLNAIIRSQQTVRAWTERDMEKNRLAKEQNQVTEATRELAKGMTKGGDKDAKDKKGDSRGEGKKGAGKGEAKEDTKEHKGDDKGKEGDKTAKEGDKEAKGGTKGSAKDGDKEAKGGSKGSDKDGDKEAKAGSKGSDKDGDKESKGGSK